MIKFIDLDKSKPYSVFKEFYDKAELSNQKTIEAISISSYDILNKEVDSRYVNLKYIKQNNWIFFTNYDSPKSFQFMNHSVVYYTYNVFQYETIQSFHIAYLTCSK